MAAPERGPVARWLYEGGPGRFADNTRKRAYLLWLKTHIAWLELKRSPKTLTAISAAGVLAVGTTAWLVTRKPDVQKQAADDQRVAYCLWTVAQVRNEFAAKQLYERCLVGKETP